MLAHLRSHAVGYLALFVALGGTSYAVATGSINSREIKNNTVRSKDIRNNNVRGKDVRSNSLTGVDIAEGTLGPVPTAENATRLGGFGPGAFAPANRAATVDVPEAAAETDVLALAGLGKLVVTACGSGTLAYEWRNTTGTAQDVWSQFADSDDPAFAPLYSSLDPGTTQSIALSGADVVADTTRIRPTDSAAVAATIHMFATTDQVPNACRVSAQAVLSG